MTDMAADPWVQFIQSGQTLRLSVDRARATAALKRNTAYLAVTCGICALIALLIVVLLATEVGRALTYRLLVILLVIMLGNVGIGLIARRRVNRVLALPGLFMEVDATSLRLAGVPPLGWAHMLGVVVDDERGILARGRGMGRRIRRLTYSIGGALQFVMIGHADLRTVRSNASGPRVAWMDLSLDDHGTLGLYLDVALNPEQCAQVCEALRAAAAVNNVPYRTTASPGFVARATWQMSCGNRLTVT